MPRSHDLPPEPHLWLDLGVLSLFAGHVSEIPLSRRVQWIALRPDAIRSDLVKQLNETRNYGCQVACVAGSRVEVAVECLEESDVKVAALIGFPFGSSDGDVKRYEVEVAVDAGAQEIHCVFNLGWLKEGLDARILRELRDIREAADERPVTAIVEMGILTPEEAGRAVRLTIDAECQFLATATGCAARQTSVEDVRLLREIAGESLGITAVGGVYGPDEASALIEAGANRVGVFSLSKLCF